MHPHLRPLRARRSTAQKTSSNDWVAGVTQGMIKGLIQTDL